MLHHHRLTLASHITKHVTIQYAVKVVLPLVPCIVYLIKWSVQLQ